MQLLLEWNQKMNLTAITIEEEIWEKHFYDSIVPFENLSHKTLCDVGSGAGFPGIPLKIVFPDMELTIVEPLQKRCRFLETVKEALDLKGVNIYPERAEDFVKEHRESYDVVSARAVARLSILLELCAPLVKMKGHFIALKGKQGHEELLEASILRKLQNRNLPLSLESMEENIFDIAGVRVIGSFLEDIYDLANYFLKQDDVHLIETKDYIQHPKPNGYRSLHLIVEIPIFLANEKKWVKVEVQFRTIAMNFWASLEHKLRYKKELSQERLAEIDSELLECAKLCATLDQKMQNIKGSKLAREL